MFLRAPVRRLGPLGYGCVGIVGLAALLAAVGPWLAPWPPDQADLTYAYVGADGSHLLGYDSQGRDLLSRLLVGARSSMLGPLLVVAVSMVAGTGLAMVAAWRRGWVDCAISATGDIVFAFPGLLLAVLAAAVVGPSQPAAALSLAVAYTPYVARLARGAALRERAAPYVEACEVAGSPAWAICARHILPNIAPVLVAEATILFGWATLDLAAISFLGLGVQPPRSDWGVMVSDGKTGVLAGYPAESVASGVALVLVVVAFTVLGERLGDPE